jgi:hypothetical protein
MCRVDLQSKSGVLAATSPECGTHPGLSIFPTCPLRLRCIAFVTLVGVLSLIGFVAERSRLFLPLSTHAGQALLARCNGQAACRPLRHKGS